MNYTEYMDHAITPLVLATELRASREGLLAQLKTWYLSTDLVAATTRKRYQQPREERRDQFETIHKNRLTAWSWKDNTARRASGTR